jgi:hypothetical protein
MCQHLAVGLVHNPDLRGHCGMRRRSPYSRVSKGSKNGFARKKALMRRIDGY